MKAVEVQDLEERISEMLRLVQETGETVAVIKDGEVIAQLVPPSVPQWIAKVPPGDVWTNLDRVRAEVDAHTPKDVSGTDSEDIWASLDRLSAKMSAHWPKDVSAVDAIRDVRREL